jgi:hypothetical protein
MINPYIIILALFASVGIATTAWGIRIMIQSRRTQDWPCVKGTITTSHSDDDELLPNIRYLYMIDNSTYEHTLEFPSGTTPTRELSQQYLHKFPEGSSVDVYYDPTNPDQAILEPGARPGDWLIFAFGLCSTILMIAALISGI